MRGETASALGPNTGSILRLITRYWINTLPSESGPGSGGSTMIRAGGCSTVNGTTAGGQVSLARSAPEPPPLAGGRRWRLRQQASTSCPLFLSLSVVLIGPEDLLLR